MSLRLRDVLPFALSLGLVPAATGWSQECSAPISPVEVEQAEDARYAAQTASDFAALERLLGDDLIYVHSTAVVDSKQSFLDSLRTGKVKYRVMRRSETRVRSYGCVALMTGLGDYEVTAGGRELVIRLRFSGTWVKRAAGLQFVSWQSTTVPPTP